MTNLSAAKVITFNRDTHDFDATFDGNYIGSFSTHHQAENELNQHVLLLCEQGLIDQPLAALAEQALGAACVPDDQPPDDFSDVGPERADSAVRTHLRYGHLRRDLFAPIFFCACGARATIVVYGDPDVMRCDDCHAAAAEPTYHAPGHCRNCGGAHHIQHCQEIRAALAAPDWRAIAKRDLVHDGMSAALAEQTIRDLAALRLA